MCEKGRFRRLLTPTRCESMLPFAPTANPGISFSLLVPEARKSRAVLKLVYPELSPPGLDVTPSNAKGGVCRGFRPPGSFAGHTFRASGLADGAIGGDGRPIHVGLVLCEHLVGQQADGGQHEHSNSPPN